MPLWLILHIILACYFGSNKTNSVLLFMGKHFYKRPSGIVYSVVNAGRCEYVGSTMKRKYAVEKEWDIQTLLGSGIANYSPDVNVAIGRS